MILGVFFIAATEFFLSLPSAYWQLRTGRPPSQAAEGGLSQQRYPGAAEPRGYTSNPGAGEQGGGGRGITDNDAGDANELGGVGALAGYSAARTLRWGFFAG